MNLCETCIRCERVSIKMIRFIYKSKTTTTPLKIYRQQNKECRRRKMQNKSRLSKESAGCLHAVNHWQMLTVASRNKWRFSKLPMTSNASIKH